MSSNSPFNFGDPSALRVDRKDPYFRLQQVTIYVRDLDRSRKFYLDQLGFSLAYEAHLESGDQWVAVAPPDGPAILALVAPKPDSEEYKLIGRHSQVAFLTEDINAKFNDWSKRGVHFHLPPHVPSWGGMLTSFEDVDGNSFGLVTFDVATDLCPKCGRIGVISTTQYNKQIVVHQGRASGNRPEGIDYCEVLFRSLILCLEQDIWPYANNRKRAIQ